MNRMALALGLVAAMSGLTACKSEDPMTITLPDAAPNDAGMTNVTPDTGTQDPPDAGPPPTCPLSDPNTIAPLPSSCLPRCEPATFRAIAGCGQDQECVMAALAADLRVPAQITTSAGAPIVGAPPLDCDLCFIWQQNTCVNDSCPAELQALVECQSAPAPDAGAGTMCAEEQQAVNACVTANMSAVQNCALDRAAMCFG